MLARPEHLVSRYVALRRIKQAGAVALISRISYDGPPSTIIVSKTVAKQAVHDLSDGANVLCITKPSGLCVLGIE